jgi:hypothetical protein
LAVLNLARSYVDHQLSKLCRIARTFEAFVHANSMMPAKDERKSLPYSKEPTTGLPQGRGDASAAA